MEETDESLKRFNLFLPINNNTLSIIDDILLLIKDCYGGCTFSRFHTTPLSLGTRRVYGYFIGKYKEKNKDEKKDYSDEDICYITFDIDEKEYPKMFDDMSVFVELLKERDEKVVWLTYYDIMLYH